MSEFLAVCVCVCVCVWECYYSMRLWQGRQRKCAKRTPSLADSSLSRCLASLLSVSPLSLAFLNKAGDSSRVIQRLKTWQGSSERLSLRWKPHEYSAGAATVRFDPKPLFKEAQWCGRLSERAGRSYCKWKALNECVGNMQRLCVPNRCLYVIATLDPEAERLLYHKPLVVERDHRNYKSQWRSLYNHIRSKTNELS